MSNNIIKKFQVESVSIPNKTAQNLSLSIEALGALTRLLSYSENFEFKFDWLQKSWSKSSRFMGRDSLRTILRELKTNGFLKLVPIQKAGSLAGYEWHISATSQDDWLSVGRAVSRSSSQSSNKKEEKEGKKRENKNNLSDKSDVVETEDTNVLSTEESSESETNQKQATLCAAAQEVLDYWKKVMKHPKAKNSKERLQKIKARLREDFSVDELKLAIDGCKKSPHHQGENETGTIHDGIKLIFKDSENVERFISYNTRKQGVKNAKQSNETINDEWQQLAGQIYSNATESSSNRLLDQ